MKKEIATENIKVTKEIKQELVKLQGKLMTDLERKVSLGEVVKYLLRFYYS